MTYRCAVVQQLMEYLEYFPMPKRHRKNGRASRQALDYVAPRQEDAQRLMGRIVHANQINTKA